MAPLFASAALFFLLVWRGAWAHAVLGVMSVAGLVALAFWVHPGLGLLMAFGVGPWALFLALLLAFGVARRSVLSRG
ncbi:MAG: hypothetical protein ABW190_01475 [Rhizobacter sp.]